MAENAPEAKGADMPETVETEEGDKPAGEAQGTVAEDATEALPVVPPMARRADGGSTKRMRFSR